MNKPIFGNQLENACITGKKRYKPKKDAVIPFKLSGAELKPLPRPQLLKTNSLNVKETEKPSLKRKGGHTVMGATSRS